MEAVSVLLVLLFLGLQGCFYLTTRTVFSRILGVIQDIKTPVERRESLDLEKEDHDNGSVQLMLE